jgi:hypothetical protein
MIPLTIGTLAMYRGKLDGRLRTLERLTPQAQDWRACQGISALLDWAKKHPSPPRDWEAFDAQSPETLSGLERCLWDARRWHAEGGTP